MLTVVGMINLPSGNVEPLVITLMKTVEGGTKHRGVIRTQTGDHKFWVPVPLLQNFSQKGGMWPLICLLLSSHLSR